MNVRSRFQRVLGGAGTGCSLQFQGKSAGRRIQKLEKSGTGPRSNGREKQEMKDLVPNLLQLPPARGFIIPG